MLQHVGIIGTKREVVQLIETLRYCGGIGYDLAVVDLASLPTDALIIVGSPDRHKTIEVLERVLRSQRTYYALNDAPLPIQRTAIKIVENELHTLANALN